MPLDPIKMKYYQLMTADPEEAQEFARLHGLSGDKLTPADTMKSASLQKIRGMIGLSPPDVQTPAPEMDVQQGMSGSAAMGITPPGQPDLLDAAVENARDQGRAVGTRDQRMDAMKDALYQMTGKKRPEKYEPSSEDQEVLKKTKKKKPESYPATE